MITLVTIELRAVSDNETELTLTHEGFPDSEMCAQNNEGWVGCLSQLENAA